jgi:hypothetical protein
MMSGTAFQPGNQTMLGPILFKYCTLPNNVTI